jgi:hypothetical protein
MPLDFNDHAIKCGINMTGKIAIPLEDSSGHLVMINITNPETGEAIIQAGTTMDCQLIDVCESYGVDYVIVYNGAHRPRYI